VKTLARALATLKGWLHNRSCPCVDWEEPPDTVAQRVILSEGEEWERNVGPSDRGAL
jgi:hypothetical protein